METQSDFRYRGGIAMMSRLLSPRRTLSKACAIAEICQL